MTINQGGIRYGFCPGKSSWDQIAVSFFQLFVVVMETQNLPFSGGVTEQPDWVVDFLGWFAPLYNSEKFNSRARSILGGKTHGNNNRPAYSAGRGGQQRR